MLKLIRNEFIKIYKRKNIYVLFNIFIILIIIINIFHKLTYLNIDIKNQYEKSFKNDLYRLNNYNELNIKEDYEDIFERINLEKYAIKYNIHYNILLKSENSNFPLPVDARILLMRLVDKIDIIIIFIIIYLSSTIISEEYNTGTIKYLLIKPHTRIKILFSKIFISFFTILFFITFVLICQYSIGGTLFGFDSYKLDAIRFNSFVQEVETMKLLNYIELIIITKIPMCLILMCISLLFGIITNNIALNILISFGIYIILASKISIIKHLIIYNLDISKYLFADNTHIKNYVIISFIIIILVVMFVVIEFEKKDIRNE